MKNRVLEASVIGWLFLTGLGEPGVLASNHKNSKAETVNKKKPTETIFDAKFENLRVRRMIAEGPPENYEQHVHAKKVAPTEESK